MQTTSPKWRRLFDLVNNVDDFNHGSLTELCSFSLLRPKYHTVSRSVSSVWNAKCDKSAHKLNKLIMVVSSGKRCTQGCQKVLK